MDPTPLNNPPVLEVVLELGVEYGSESSAELFRAFVASLEGDYPQVDSVTTEGEDGEEHVRGYAAYNPERTRVVQVGDWGFTLNELAPYSSWKDTAAVARPVWDRFRKAFSVGAVTRLGLRYINVLDFPSDEGGDRQLLNSWPPFCGDLIERDPAGFTLSMDVPLKEPGVRALVYHGLGQGEGGTVQLVVDNYVYVPAYDGPVDGVWDEFERLRAVKNRLFFEAVTDAALDPYR